MIRKAQFPDAAVITALALLLWPDNKYEEMLSEFENHLQNPECGLFLAFDRETAIGFAQCQLRHDYVEGTESSPVGYLEGIFVSDAFRGKGIARHLLTACENWAKEMGCGEFASDCELTNKESLAFHLHTGFTEANRIICFTKQL